MDDQFRNRLRRYDNGAPIAPRPSAPRPIARPEPPVKPVAPPQPKPIQPTPSTAWASPSAALQAPVRPAYERPVAPSKQADAPAKKTKKQRVKKRKGAKRGRKVVLLLLVLLLLAGGGAAALWFKIRPRFLQTNSANVAPVTKSAPSAAKLPAPGKLIRLVAVGDSITYSSINQAAQKGSDYDYATMMSAIKPILGKAAVRICSQTVPAGGAGAGGISGPPTFNAPPQFAKALESTGCNVIDMASANANDKGQAAIDASISNYDGHSSILAIAGTNRSAEAQNKIHYFTVEGLKFAYLAYTTKSNVPVAAPFSVNTYSDAIADAQIAEAHKNAAVVLVSMHWGTDYNQDVDASQDTIAQHLAAQNVDIVIGNGPHVIEPVKVLTGTNSHQTIVWFSLGNFVSSQVPVETLIGGMAVMDLDSSTQQLHNPRLLPLYMHYEWTPEQKAKQSEADLLARKNFQVVPLDLAANLLAKSQNGTTVQAQQARVKGVISKYFQIPLITSTEF